VGLLFSGFSDLYMMHFYTFTCLQITASTQGLKKEPNQIEKNQYLLHAEVWLCR